MLNRIKVLLFLAIALFTCIKCTVVDKNKQLPNVVVVLVDDMGYGDAQCYQADSKIPTPNINQLAADGILFTDGHSPASVCTPSRYSILTGRYAWRTRLKKSVLGPYNQPLIENDRLTVPKMLKEKGYQTANIGKWHLGMRWATKDNAELPLFWDNKFDKSVIDHSMPISEGPLTVGFDYFFGVDLPNMPPYIFIENDRVLGVPDDKKPADMYGLPGKMLPGWELEDLLPTLTSKAVEYIDNYAKSGSDKPFYLHFTTTSPHTPIVPSKEFVGKSEAGPYGDLMHQTDYSLGQIIKALDRNGLSENTIVIFTSDNGSPSRAGDPHIHGPKFQIPGSVISMFNHNPNAPLRGMKTDIHEGGHRVPFIIKWPANLPANVRSDETICAIDIMATLASVVGYELPQNAAEDSYSFLEMLKNAGNSKQVDGESIREATVHHSNSGLFAIRKGDWKMIPSKGNGGWTHKKSLKKSNDSAKGQLYNLKLDPQEQHNLWDDRQDIVIELKALLDKYKKEGRSLER